MNCKSVKIDGSFFGMPENLFEHIDIWVHEFTERTIFNIISDEYYPYARFSIGGSYYYHNVGHWVTSLCCVSLLEGRLINPDDLALILMKNRGSETRVRKNE